jgi:hypothetical protein
MPSRPGPSPKLSAVAIRRVLRWHLARQRFLEIHGTASQLAQDLGVSLHAIRRAMSPRKTAPHLLMPTGRGRGASRLPQLEAAQLATVHRWAVAQRRFKANHPTAQALATTLGVSRRVIFDCIRRGGRYKKNARSRLPGKSQKAPRRPPSIRTADRTRRAETALRAELLRQWRSPSMSSPSKPPRRLPER